MWIQLNHKHWWVRRSALEAAGRLCLTAVAAALVSTRRNPHYGLVSREIAEASVLWFQAGAAVDREFLVRRMACLCAAQLATAADVGH